MSLSEYTPERFDVKLSKGGSFSVRGLSAEDFSSLLREHMPHIDQMFDLYSKQTQDVFATGAAEKLVMTVVKDFPQITAAVIALAADEPGTEDKARKLPLPVQIQAIHNIGRLTFEEVGGPKAFFASLKALMGGLAAPAVKTLKAHPKLAVQL